jgi:tetratricopeptide (TPR) repeat protein
MAVMGAGMPGYEVLQELGRGGMGVVYEARQIGPNRVCALKMILAGGHAGAAELARFRTEAEAIGRLQHPNIVQVFEVGEHAGLPYFSLEFCAGGSLEKKLDGTPLPPREAARLVETLARAMQAAHQANVIHRDLKPANVLLTADGLPKISDFGLARKLDEVGQTASNAIVGTPSYMAPEQAGGKSKEMGPATDVYALGAILYECVTGRPPFKAATVMDTLHQVVANEPVPPRQLQPRTPRDLETITLKCLHKEPARRYATAADLAADLKHFLAGEPIAARPVGGVEKAWKWVKRNPVVSAMTAAIVLLLLGSSVVIYAKYLDAREQKKEADELRIAAETREKEANQLRQAAEQFSQRAKRTLDQAGKDDEKTRHAPGAQVLRRELMQSALRFYQDFAAYYPDDRALRAGLADTHLRLAVATGRVRPIREAMQSFEKGVRILEEQIAREPDNVDLQVRLAEAYFDLGQLAFEREQYAEAEKILARAEKLLTPLAARQPGNVRALLCLAGVNHRLDSSRWNLSGRKPAEALVFCQANARRLDALLEKHPDNVDALYWRGKFANNIALTYDDLKQPQAYARNLDEAVDRFTRALRLSPDRPDVLFDLTNTLRNKAWSLRSQNRLADAVSVYEQAIAKANRLVARNPDVPRYRQFLAKYNYQIAGFHESNREDEERFTRASRAYEQAAQLYAQLEAHDRTAPVYAQERLRTLVALADMEKDRGRSEAARNVLERAVQAARAAVEALPSEEGPLYQAAWTHFRRGELDLEDKQPAKALPYLRESVEIFRTRLLRLKLSSRAGYLNDYLTALEAARAAAAKSGQQDEAIRLAEKGRPVWPELVNFTQKQRWCDLMNRLAELYVDAGKLEAAAATLEKPIAAGRAALAQAPWHYYMRNTLVKAYRQRAEIHQARGEVKEEVLLRRQMLALRERLDGRSYAAYTAASDPLTADEAKRLRSVGADKGVKRFTVPLTLNGRPWRSWVYVSNHVPQTLLDPMEDQDRVLQEDHGVRIPKEIRDSFNRLYKIAMEKKVSFGELCAYSLRSDGDSPTDPVARAKAKEAIDRQKKEADDLKTALAGDPTNRGLRHRAAKSHLDLARALVHNHEEKAGVDAWEQARGALEGAGPPGEKDEADLALRAEVYHYLGEYRRFRRDLDAAYALYRRSAELLARLERVAAPGRYRKARAMALCCLANVEAARGETREMMRWLCEAAWARDETSLRLLREVVENHPLLKSGLPESLASACRALRTHLSHKDPRARELSRARERCPDLASTLYVLVQNGRAGEKPTWSYVAVKPSKAVAFADARKRKGFNPGELAVVLASGQGKEPPAEVREKMKRDYKMPSDHEDELRKVVHERRDQRFRLLEKAPGETGPGQPSMFDRLFADEFAILLLRGSNARGERIWCYLKVNIAEYKRLTRALKGDQEFSISDYGTVIAAGRGEEPPADVKEAVKLAFPGTTPHEGRIHRGKNAPKEKKP